MNSMRLPRRYSLLDGLRGIAALAVACFHLCLYKYRIFSGIVILVDFFFVLSGFVLADSLLKRGSGSVKKFLIARAIRLYPTVFAAFVLIFMAQTISYLRNETTAVRFSYTQYLMAFLLLQVLVPSIYSINIPLWSLSAELFVNIFAALIPKKRMYLIFMVTLGLLFEVIGLGGMLPKHFLAHFGVMPNLWWIGRAFEGFYLGLLLHHSKVASSDSKNQVTIFRKSRLAVILGLLISIYALVVFSTKLIFLAAPIFYLLIDQIIRIREESIAIRYREICIYLGKLSFGIYVFHEPISQIISGKFLEKYLYFDMHSIYFLILGFNLKLLLTVAAAYISLKFIENPFRKWANRRFLT